MPALLGSDKLGGPCRAILACQRRVGRDPRDGHLILFVPEKEGLRRNRDWPAGIRARQWRAQNSPFPIPSSVFFIISQVYPVAGC